MNREFEFLDAGRLPAASDNVAIAVRRLESGDVLNLAGGRTRLQHTLLEGHRFAVAPIPEQGWLLSWGLPFGRALRPIAPGEYVCNASILKALSGRHVDFELPFEPNFQDEIVPFVLDPANVVCGRQVELHETPGVFRGYLRSQGRGAGTRNFIGILGVSSRCGSFVQELAGKFASVSSNFGNVDGVVALAHTEGGGSGTPHNLELSARTLAGFVAHPNLAAVLAVDEGGEPLNNAVLRRALRDRWGEEARTPMAFLSLEGGWELAMRAGERLVQGWLAMANAAMRTEVPLSHLRVGLQCGGSDAYSGVSGNPLVGWIAKELIRHGGAANLAETSELIGAEPYVLSNVKNLDVAQAFLRTQRRFQTWAGWHGHSAEGNPSGGNMYRGLYNIAIKSIGAARKKGPEVRLDAVIDFGEPMVDPGYYFMDSPGNDLESIAGQVASGCNLILFSTGNGSITNFPFVPTIKVMTSTGRFRMLSKEMDFNAGRYLDGEPMESLGLEAFELSVRAASGERTAGEKAGHAQLQLWREWRQSGRKPDNAASAKVPSGFPLPKPVQELPAEVQSWVDARRGGAWAVPFLALRSQLGLVLPTSLCAGQIARMVAETLMAGVKQEAGLNSFVALPHTEGCGNSGGESEHILMRIMTGHLFHPRVGAGLLMEHGCEKTHNDAFRNWMESGGGDLSRFGWTSIQLDGGIEATVVKAVRWFENARRGPYDPARPATPLPALGIAVTEAIPDSEAYDLQILAQAWLALGGSVVFAPGPAVCFSDCIQNWLACESSDTYFPTLACGERITRPGLHWMDTPTDDLVEAWSALAASGVEAMVVWSRRPRLQQHPFVPLVAWKAIDSSGSPGTRVLQVLEDVMESAAQPAQIFERTAFQVTRGRHGVSL